MNCNATEGWNTPKARCGEATLRQGGLMSFESFVRLYVFFSLTTASLLAGGVFCTFITTRPVVALLPIAAALAVTSPLFLVRGCGRKFVRFLIYGK